MNIETLHNYCMGKKAVSACFPFDDTTLVFKVTDKMFAIVHLDLADKVILKCQPEYALELREQYRGIEPAFHCNKKHWNQVYLTGDVPDSLIRSLIDHSYNEVIKKFTKKKKAIYDQLP